MPMFINMTVLIRNAAVKFFMEDLPFAKASQIRTDAFHTLILGVSMFLSNEGASKVLKLLGIHK